MNCGCRNSETCKCAPVLDINDLRDKIKKLKVTKAELLQTSETLTQEIDNKSHKLRETKQYRMQVDPDPELRMITQNTSNSNNANSSLHSTYNNNKDIDDQQFRIANEKLEMQILMQEIRAALPTLEKEVRFRESVASQGKKTSAKLSKAVGKSESLQPTLWEAPSELKARVQEAVELAIASKTLRTSILDSEKRKNAELSESVSSHRRELALKLRERDHLREVIGAIDQQWRQEKYRQQLLREEHLTMREKLKRFHGGFGFQTEAFLQEAQGDAQARLSVQRVTAALRKWLFPVANTLKNSNNYGNINSGDPSASWLSEHMVQEQLQLIFNTDNYINNNSNTMNNISNSSNKNSRVSLSSVDAFHYYDEHEETNNKTNNICSNSNNSNNNSEHKGEEEKENFSSVVEALMQKPANNTNSKTNNCSDIPVTEVDLKTFCMLCDRLIVVYDA